MTTDLRQLLGEIDIYLLDQIMRGNFRNRRTILDAGCGNGRNLVHFLREGYAVHAADRSAEAVARTRTLAAALRPDLPEENFRAEEIENLTFPEAFFDGIICSAVLHFAENEEHFNAMLDRMWRTLAPGGLLFTRLASDIGIEDRVERLDRRWARLPDGSSRFLVDLDFLLSATARLDAELTDPIKTVNVQNLRCMTTWSLRKKPFSHDASGKHA